ncbi:methyltransferase domain-containing protein [Actinoplanes sp. NPDC026619]|uniref:class I SAM-dependent methyltransferase n=1 Tax=Actinoplanes sp. NPDC026619 TaxID=3155798 RepID=UPI0033EC6ADB
MSGTRDAAHWAGYNDAQAGRAVRELCADVIELAGPGAGRTAVDLGCGAGIEAAALLAAGWRVHAVDSAPGTIERVGVHEGLTVVEADLATLGGLPAAGLIYSGYSLQYLAPEGFERLWGMIRDSLRPGGWLAVDLLGDRDEWAGTPGETFLSEGAVRALVDGLDLVRLDEEDAEGPAYGGTKHWHVFHVVATRPPGP